MRRLRDPEEAGASGCYSSGITAAGGSGSAIPAGRRPGPGGGHDLL